MVSVLGKIFSEFPLKFFSSSIIACVFSISAFLSLLRAFCRLQSFCSLCMAEIFPSCFEQILITQNRDNVSLYRSDSPSVPMFVAPLNDKNGREVRGSHGEALTSYKGLDTVMLKDNVLVFLNETKVKFAGIPAGTESDRYAFKLDNQGRLLAERKTSEPFGSDGHINCVYKK